MVIQLCISSCYHQTIDKTRNQENFYITGGENINTLSDKNKNGWYPINIAAFL